MAICREVGFSFSPQDRADHWIGSRIRERREQQGLSQDQVAEEIGWFAAQLDDCENGFFRAPERDLFLLADVLGVEIGYFRDPSDGFPVAISRSKSRQLAVGFAEASASLLTPPAREATPPQEPEEPQVHADGIELFRTYARIRDPRKRAMLLDLGETFAKEG